MPRSLRLTSAGLWHHVMNRGAGRQVIFLDDTDRRLFLSLLAECRARWGLVTHAVVLMSNHFHLLVEDRQQRLSPAMRHLLGVYTQRFNKRHDRDGALLRGRFRSRLVDSEEYLTELVRYIHANPIEAGLVEKAALWPWSSHPHYLTPVRPPWLETSEVLSRFGGDTPAGRAALDLFVHERAPEAARALLTDGWPVLGEESFENTARKAVRGEASASHVAQARFAAPTPQEVVEVVAERFECAPDDITRGVRGQRNLARQLAILICARYLPATGAEVGAVLGLAPATVSSWALKVRRLLSANEDEQRILSEVLEQLGLESTPRR